MTIGLFTVEEINLIAIYLGDTRTETIMQLAEAIPYMDEDMITIAESASQKLAGLEEEEYAESSFIPADETEE